MSEERTPYVVGISAAQLREIESRIDHTGPGIFAGTGERMEDVTKRDLRTLCAEVRRLRALLHAPDDVELLGAIIHRAITRDPRPPGS